MKVKICGFKHHYIDEQGVVYNEKTGNIVNSYISKVGYPVVDIYENNIRKKRYIHRLLCEAFIPNPENKQTINHKDGDKTNNNLDNLEWATYSENIQHAYNHNLNYSERKADFTNETFCLVWDEFITEHLTITELGKRHGIATPTMSTYMNNYVKTHKLYNEYREELYKQKCLRQKAAYKHEMKICMCDKETHQELKQFDSLKKAARYLGVVSSGPISNVIANRQKSAYGYWWKRI